jgi:hypothetical protein
MTRKQARPWPVMWSITCGPFYIFCRVTPGGIIQPTLCRAACCGSFEDLQLVLVTHQNSLVSSGCAIPFKDGHTPLADFFLWCGGKVGPHFHKAAALTSWGRSHSRIAAYLHGITSFRVFSRSNAVTVSPLVMHISATTVNDRIMKVRLIEDVV